MPREENPFSEGKSCYVVHKLLYDVISNKLCEEDPITSDWESSKVMINNGEIATMTLGSWAIQQCMDAGEHPEDIGATIGDWKPQAGAWIRFNPVDGAGVRNENVTRFRYALVEEPIDSVRVDVGRLRGAVKLW